LGEIEILIGEKIDDARKYFDSVTLAATQNNPYISWYETQPMLLFIRIEVTCKQTGQALRIGVDADRCGV